MSCSHWEAWNTRVRLSLSLQPTQTHWIQQICRINLCYYHTDMKVTRKLFMGGQRARAVTLLQLFLHGLWSSLSLKRLHYSSPGFAKNGLFSLWPGVTYPTACTSLPTPPGHPLLPDKQPFFSPPLWRRSWSHRHTVHTRRFQEVPEHDGLVKRPGALLPQIQ